MAGEAPEAISAWEAIKFLSPLIGYGGIAAMVVAYFGSKRPQIEQAKKAEGIGIQALLADHMVMERFVEQLKRLADSGEELVTVLKRFQDTMEIVRTIEQIRSREPPR